MRTARTSALAVVLVLAPALPAFAQDDSNQQLGEALGNILINSIGQAVRDGAQRAWAIRMRAGDVGRDGYGVYVTPVKRYRPRFVFLPDEGMTFFLKLAAGKERNTHLFVRNNSKDWYCHHRHLFKAAVRAAKLPEEFTFHGLRHTYASQLVQAGTPLPVVAEQLGHANSDTVSRTYGHLAPQVREAEVRQRFTTVNIANARAAKKQRKALNRWRSSLHGSDWRTYAKINDARSRSN